jgi:CheY-like chemotaxis protein
MHRGRVEAHSAGIRQGSEFTVRLPLLISEPPNQSRPSNTAGQSAVASRILIVDDNVDSADSLAMMLRMSGHDVQTAYSGQAALAAAMEYEPSIVLLDIGLPEVDGYEIARQLRQRAEFKAVWLIAITGYGQDADLQRSRDAGFDHHLVKPVDPQKLEELLARLTKK